MLVCHAKTQIWNKACWQETEHGYADLWKLIRLGYIKVNEGFPIDKLCSIEQFYNVCNHIHHIIGRWHWLPVVLIKNKYWPWVNVFECVCVCVCTVTGSSVREAPSERGSCSSLSQHMASFTGNQISLRFLMRSAEQS